MSYTAVDIDVDEADVLVLSQGLEKSNKLTYEIGKSLSEISQTSSQSSTLFGPILSRNNMLVTLQRNIESTLNSVASVKDLANEASKYEIILMKGVRKVGLKQYTQVMHKVDDMLEDIRTGNEKNAEFHGIMSHLEDLIRKSEGELKAYFVAILNSIDDFDPQINMEKKIPFPYYEDQQLEDITWILDYFYNNSEGSVIEIAFIQQRSEKIMKCMGFIEPFVKKITASKNAPYERGSNGILNYTEALLGFISNEKTLVDDLYSQYLSLKPGVIASILNPILNTYSKLFQSNIKSVESNMENMGLYSFELTDSVQSVLKSLRFNQKLEYHPNLLECLQKVKHVTKLLFKDTVKRIDARVNAMKSIASDNGVAEPTIDTMSRLRKFSEYKQGCLNAINGMSRDEWMVINLKDKESTFNASFLPHNASNHQLLSCFYSDCFDVLLVSLEKRASQILSNGEVSTKSISNKHKQRVGFFVLSNITLIVEIAERSEINMILGNEGKTRLDKAKKKYVSYMVQDWRELTSILMDSIHTDGTGKKSKDKDVLKEKFRKFNEGFETLISTLGQYRMTDLSLKNTLKSEIISLIIPMYERFYGRYKDAFKNRNKHIKYTPSELSDAINRAIK